MLVSEQEVQALASASMSVSILGHDITLRAKTSFSPPLSGRDASLPRVAAAAFKEPPPEFPKANIDPLRSARGVECDMASAL